MAVAQTPGPQTKQTAGRSPLPFLLAQGFFAGFALALLYAVANTVFLVDYGAENLPYVYIAIAIFVPLLSTGYAALEKRWPLPRLVLFNIAGFTLLFIVSWYLTTRSSARWISFVLMAAFNFALSFVLMAVSVQAGRLFDLRQMKSQYPLVLASQTLALIVSGLAVAPLARLLGDVGHLLLLGGASLGIVLLLVVLTIRSFPDRFYDIGPAAVRRNKAQAKSLAQLLRKRYVARIFLYQMLSALGTQLVVFIFTVQADLRFDAADSLASFFGAFMAIGTLITLIFLVVASGPLLRRFGLRFGLAANPAAVSVAVILMAAVAVFAGPMGILFFWLAVGARALDFVLTVGTTDTSVKAMYQALPEGERVTVQTAVEGIGIPIAYGIAGLSLLAFAAAPGLNATHIVFYTLLACILWGAAAFLVYRDYGNSLLKTVSRRALSAVDLALEDGSSLHVLERLCRSEDVAQMRLALDLLERSQHPQYAAQVLETLNRQAPAAQLEALARVERSRLAAAAGRVQMLLSSGDPGVRGAAIRALCALAEPAALERAVELLHDGDERVRAGAWVGLLRYGGVPGIMAAGRELMAAAQSADAGERRLAARVVGEVAVSNFYQPLVPLLQDTDMAVRQEALLAAARVGHPRLLHGAIANLDIPRLRSPAMAALAGSGELVLPVLARALAGESDLDEDTVIRLVRACGQLKSEAAAGILKHHLTHRSLHMRTQVLAALSQCDFRAEGQAEQEVRGAIALEIEHAVRVLRVEITLGEEEGLAPLQRALDDELEQVRKRVFLLLSFLYQSRPMLRAAEQLAAGESSARAFAMEMLDVTLEGPLKASILPLIEPDLSPEKRLAALGAPQAPPHSSREMQLRGIIVNAGGFWSQTWTRACAIYAAGQLLLPGLASDIQSARSQPAPISETAQWALQRLAHA